MMYGLWGQFRPVKIIGGGGERGGGGGTTSISYSAKCVMALNCF